MNSPPRGSIEVSRALLKASLVILWKPSTTRQVHPYQCCLQPSAFQLLHRASANRALLGGQRAWQEPMGSPARIKTNFPGPTRPGDPNFVAPEPKINRLAENHGHTPGLHRLNFDPDPVEHKFAPPTLPPLSPPEIPSDALLETATNADSWTAAQRLVLNCPAKTFDIGLTFRKSRSSNKR